MKSIIECRMCVFSSHSFSEAGGFGSNKYYIKSGFELTSPFGHKDTYVRVTKVDDGDSFSVYIESMELDSLDKQTAFLEKCAALFSFVVGKGEPNAQMGTPFIDVDLKSLSVKLSSNSKEENEWVFGGYTEAESHAYIELGDLKTDIDDKNGLLVFYRDGLKAESAKSKYFHWFLLLEYLEYTNLYCQLNPVGTLFSNEEREEVDQFSKGFDDRKKAMFKKMLDATHLGRPAKLLNVLNHIGLLKFTVHQHEYIVDVELVKSLVDTRNRLFHRGASFDKDILWLKLYPLVTKVVEQLLFNKKEILLD